MSRSLPLLICLLSSFFAPSVSAATYKVGPGHLCGTPDWCLGRILDQVTSSRFTGDRSRTARSGSCRGKAQLSSRSSSGSARPERRAAVLDANRASVPTGLSYWSMAAE